MEEWDQTYENRSIFSVGISGDVDIPGVSVGGEVCVYVSVRGGFSRVGGVAKILMGGRMVRRSSIDVSEIRIRAEAEQRNREKNGISFRIEYGWRGSDLRMAIREDRPRGDCAWGWQMPQARRDGISMNISVGMKWGGNLIQGNFIRGVDRRIGKYRSENDGMVPTKHRINRHRGGDWAIVGKWGLSRKTSRRYYLEKNAIS